MDFNKANNFEKEKQSSKKILVIAITLIIILGIAATSIYFYTANAKKKILKIYINAVNWSRYGDSTVVDKKRLASNSVIKEGNKYYFAIKDFAEIAGFNFYRGDRTTEEETKAYIENNSERVTFVSGAKEIRKYYLTSSSSSSKNSSLILMILFCLKMESYIFRKMELVERLMFYLNIIRLLIIYKYIHLNIFIH